MEWSEDGRNRVAKLLLRMERQRVTLQREVGRSQALRFEASSVRKALVVLHAEMDARLRDKDERRAEMAPPKPGRARNKL